MSTATKMASPSGRMTATTVMTVCCEESTPLMASVEDSAGSGSVVVLTTKAVHLLESVGDVYEVLACKSVVLAVRRAVSRGDDLSV